jgi:hypothetical protein
LDNKRTPLGRRVGHKLLNKNRCLRNMMPIFPAEDTGRGGNCSRAMG